MPHSSHYPVSLMLEHVVRVRPARVLDIGPGYGKWGYLVREALDFMENRLERSEWSVEIDGIDAFPYQSPLLDWVYNRVEHADVLDRADSIKGYDLVIMGDVIEHFTKADGKRLLRTLLGQNGCVLLTTPVTFFQQEVAQNPFEHHLSHWSREDFSEWIFDYDVVSDAAIVVLIAGLGATYPGRQHAVSSRLVYSLPGIRARGSVARVLKGVVLRALGSA